jgi:glycosyltransferase involved in cell wall biosynthesis
MVQRTGIEYKGSDSGRLAADLTMASSPEITVLMPVYNGERFLADAIESILRQSHRDYELLILDDGSTDGGIEIAGAYDDPRIRIVRNDSNLGLVKTRNRGIREARGAFIAFLDSDDIALRHRLRIQFDFLEKNPEYALVGSRVVHIDEKGDYSGGFSRFEASSAAIPSILLFDNYFAQSAVMARRDVLESELYREGFPCAEDYDLFARITARRKTWNIPQVLTLYRDHGGGTSKKRRDLIVECTKKVYAWQLNRLGIDPGPEELDLHGSLGCIAPDLPGYDLSLVRQWLKELLRHNEQRNLYRQDEFNSLILEKMALACVEKVHPVTNLLRHYFGFSWMGNGAKVRVLAKILGRNLAKKTYGLNLRYRGLDEFV